MFVNGYFVGKILHLRSLPLCCGLATPGTESEAFQELSWDLVGRQGFEDTWGFVFCCWWWWSSWKNWLFRVAPGYFTYLHIILNVLCFLVIVIFFRTWNLQNGEWLSFPNMLGLRSTRHFRNHSYPQRAQKIWWPNFLSEWWFGDLWPYVQLAEVSITVESPLQNCFGFCRCVSAYHRKDSHTSIILMGLFAQNKAFEWFLWSN